MKKNRNIAVSFVLIVASLATVATSPAYFQIDDEVSLALTAPDVVTFRVALSQRAVEEAGTGHLSLFATGEFDELDTLLVVPDDDELEVADLLAVVDPEFQQALQSIYFLDACAEAEPCELGFTLDAEGEGEVEVEVRAIVDRQHSEFSDDATVEVVIDG